MPYKVIPSSPFLKEFNKLKKRYPSLKEDVLDLAEKLETHPEMGQVLGG